MTTRNLIAADTNVLIYSLDQSNMVKQKSAIAILDQNPYIFSQNMSELINVLRYKWKIKKSDCEFLVKQILDVCTFLPTSKDVYLNAFDLVRKYNFQLFDAIIAASALECGCGILYTEDMQHGLLIEARLKIKNPFL